MLTISLGRDYGTTRGYANESEFTVVKVSLNPFVLRTPQIHLDCSGRFLQQHQELSIRAAKHRHQIP